MRLRRTSLITAAVSAALITAVPLTAVAATPSAATASAPATSCTTIDALSSSTSAAATNAFWTPANTAATANFDNLPVGATSSSAKSPVPAAASSTASQVCAALADTSASSLAATAAAPAGVTPATTAINGYPSVGKFFFDIASIGKLNCTASVINDAKGNPKQELVLTAAHCFEGLQDGIPYTSDDWLFAPEWHNNDFPYGKWDVKAVYVDSNWFTCTIECHENPRYDYAVLVVDPKSGHGVGHYTGLNGWKINAPKSVDNARIVGIPGNSGKALVNVTNTTTVTINPGGYPARKASTPGFGDGSSGGPWFSTFNTKSGVGVLFGDTGGYDSGGPTDSPSYSSVWGNPFSVLVDGVANKYE